MPVPRDLGSLSCHVGDFFIGVETVLCRPLIFSSFGVKYAMKNSCHVEFFAQLRNSERCTGTICDFCAFGSMLNSHYTKTLMKEEENKFRFSSKSDRDQRTAKCKKHKVSLLISCIKDSCEQRKEETHEVETG